MRSITTTVIKIQVHYDWNQIDLGSSSTIPYRGKKLKNGQQVKFVDRLSILSREKTLEHLIKGKTTVEYQN